MNSRQISLLVGIFVLGLVVIACTINIGGPAYPIRTIPVSTEAMGDLKSSVETAVAAGAESGKVTFAFTESQLTSYLSYSLKPQSQPIITKPQVYLQDGQILLYGTASNSYFIATARIVLTAGVDNLGQLKIELTSANFGPLPVPNGLNEIITATIQEAYAGALGPIATGFRLESISIADGTMTVIGNTK